MKDLYLKVEIDAFVNEQPTQSWAYFFWGCMCVGSSSSYEQPRFACNSFLQGLCGFVHPDSNLR